MGTEQVLKFVKLGYKGGVAGSMNEFSTQLGINLRQTRVELTKEMRIDPTVKKSLSVKLQPESDSVELSYLETRGGRQIVQRVFKMPYAEFYVAQRLVEVMMSDV